MDSKDSDAVLIHIEGYGVDVLFLLGLEYLIAYIIPFSKTIDFVISCRIKEELNHPYAHTDLLRTYPEYAAEQII